MSLPRQKLPISQKTDTWKKDTVNYYESLARGTYANNRNSRYTKRINYDLFNGKFNKADLEYVCNPLGLPDNEFPATLQHYDVISPSLNLLIGEETKRPDNIMVISESPNDINRKETQLKDKLTGLLQEHLMAEIDPSTVDPNQPLPTPDQILKYAKHNVSDLIESQANKMLKYVRKQLNTKEIFKKGWKDALVAGEEIYWSGIINNNVALRRCNPINITVLLDGDSDFIDDAISVIEERMLSVASIIDEFGDELTSAQISDLEQRSRRAIPFGNSSNNPVFRLENTDAQLGVVDNGRASNYAGVSTNMDLVRVLRVEWKSFKKLYHIIFTDEDGVVQEDIVDETFKPAIFKQAFSDVTYEEFWVTEAWEGVKIHTDIFVGIGPKPNQRRRMDDPYSCKLGYTGLIYNATNSISISLIDRLKPYQYLYNVLSYRLELAFANDQGKKVVVDLAQIPRSEGIDLDKWMYYLKAMGIMFINSFEEGRKGASTGKFSAFNQFSSIDLSMANTIQSYIESLEYIKQQIAFVSGVSPQRLGAISSQELVGNVERAVTQSALITEYLFDSHDEVKRRVYTSLVECAKIAFKTGKKAQYVLDDMGIEMLNIEEFEFENSEFNVYMSNSNKDQQVVETLKQLSIEALKADKADLSTIIDTVINNNPKDISNAIKRGEEAKYARMEAEQQRVAEIEQSKIQAQKEMQQLEIQERQKDRDLKQYEVDQNNETKIYVQEIANYFQATETDVNQNGIPDPMEIAAQAHAERELDSKNFMESNKLRLEGEKIRAEYEKKQRELDLKKEIEDKKIKAIDVQNVSQEKIAQAQLEADKKKHAVEIQIEKERMKLERELAEKEMKIKEKELKLKEKETSSKERIEQIKLKMIEKKAKADEAKHKMDMQKGKIDLQKKKKAATEANKPKPKPKQ